MGISNYCCDSQKAISCFSVGTKMWKKIATCRWKIVRRTPRSARSGSITSKLFCIWAPNCKTLFFHCLSRESISKINSRKFKTPFNKMRNRIDRWLLLKGGSQYTFISWNMRFAQMLDNFWSVYSHIFLLWFTFMMPSNFPCVFNFIEELQFS